MKNKRGQGLSTQSIILIILGVVVLVLLIAGFTLGWSTILPFLKTNNVDTIVTACSTACTTGSTYDYCSMERELKDGEGNKIKASCAVFSVVPDFDMYGIDRCDSIDCKLPCTEITVNSEEAVEPSINGFNLKQCNTFNGKKSECLDKSKGEDWCIWSEGSKTCLGTYKTPETEVGKYYDVSDVSTTNRDTGICGVPK